MVIWAFKAAWVAGSRAPAIQSLWKGVLAMLEVVVKVPAGGSYLEGASAALEVALGETLAGAKVLATYASAHHPWTREELDHTLHRAITYALHSSF